MKWFSLICLAIIPALGWCNNNDILNLRNTLQEQGRNIEVREIRMKYFQPHCYGTYGVFQMVDGGFQSFKMYPWGVVYYENSVQRSMDIVSFSQMTHPNTTQFIQVTQ